MDTIRIRRWIYGLWYPALLGAFGLALAGPEPPSGISAHHQWGWIVVLYLTIQFGEGAEPDRQYDWIGLLRDVLEMCAIIAFFISLGYLFPAQGLFESLRGTTGAKVSLAILLLIPVAFRLWRYFRETAEAALMNKHSGFYISISSLSLFAAFLAFVGFESEICRILVALILGIYLVFFVLFNHAIACPTCDFRRPEGFEIDKARKAPPPV